MSRTIFRRRDAPWLFVPWLFVAQYLSLVALGSCSPPATAPEPFDHSRVLISLERTACLGTCPDYKVTIDGNGNVAFSTEKGDSVAPLGAFGDSETSWVVVPGTHRDKISKDAVDKLLRRFSEANFARLKTKYVAEILDVPSQTITLDIGQGPKQVIDSEGRKVGMPEAVTELESAVDQAAGTERWVRGAAGLIPWLERTKFDFGSRTATILALRGIGVGDDATLLALVSRGAPLDWKDPKLGIDRPPGVELLEGSIRHGKPALFRYLVAKGWLPRLTLRSANAAFAESAAGCEPSMVDAAAAAGLSIDAGSLDDEQFLVDRDEAALAVLAKTYNCDNEVKRIATARRLLARGADPNRRDHGGETAIFAVENLELLNLLLAHGADATAKDRRGASAVFATWTDEIVLRLLQAGASPIGRDLDGKTLPELTKQHSMPLVATWLARHDKSVAAGNRKGG